MKNQHYLSSQILHFKKSQLSPKQCYLIIKMKQSCETKKLKWKQKILDLINSTGIINNRFIIVIKVMKKNLGQQKVYILLFIYFSSKINLIHFYSYYQTDQINEMYKIHLNFASILHKHMEFLLLIVNTMFSILGKSSNTILE